LERGVLTAAAAKYLFAYFLMIPVGNIYGKEVFNYTSLKRFCPEKNERKSFKNLKLKNN